MDARASSPIEVGALIDSRPLTVLQMRVIFLSALVLLLDGYDVQVMALAVPSVAKLWGQQASSFGLALSASLIGMGFGAGLIAPIGDRIGRRPLMVGGLLLAGVTMLGSSLAHTQTDFVLWRIATGVGIGFSLANATALTSEYMPARRRGWLVCLMYCNIALGAFSAGLFAPWALNVMDWHGLFILGGIGTLVAATLVWLGVPESLKFLIARRPGHRAIGRVLARLAPGTDPAVVFVEPESKKKLTIIDLLGGEYRARTLVLWSIYVLNVFVIYMLSSWLATLLTIAGWPRDQALLGSVLFQLGGVGGSLLLSLFMDSGRSGTALALGYLLCAAGLAGLLFAPSNFNSWAPLLLLVGFGISGAQCVLVALAASFYPLPIRATGVGWAVTIGRVGAIGAPLLGQVIIQIVSPVHALAILIIPALGAAAFTKLIKKSWVVG